MVTDTRTEDPRSDPGSFEYRLDIRGSWWDGKFSSFSKAAKGFEMGPRGDDVSIEGRTSSLSTSAFISTASSLDRLQSRTWPAKRQSN